MNQIQLTAELPGDLERLALILGAATSAHGDGAPLEKLEGLAIHDDVLTVVWAGSPEREMKGFIERAWRLHGGDALDVEHR